MSCLVRLLVGAGLVAACHSTAAQSPSSPSDCELNKRNSYTFEYRRERWPKEALAQYDWQRKDVESNHFPPQTEMLVRPRHTSGTIGADVSYMLERWPNHHRGLNALVRLGDREKTEVPKGSKYTIRCWFERALVFARDDTVVRGLYASYLGKKGQKEEALLQLEELKRQAGDNPLSHHNAGLVYLELGEHDKALQQAHLADSYGLTMQNKLREQLEALGKWKPRPASSGDAVDGAASAASAPS